MVFSVFLKNLRFEIQLFVGWTNSTLGLKGFLAFGVIWAVMKDVNLNVNTVNKCKYSDVKKQTRDECQQRLVCVSANTMFLLDLWPIRTLSATKTFSDPLNVKYASFLTHWPVSATNLLLLRPMTHWMFSDPLTSKCHYNVFWDPWPIKCFLTHWPVSANTMFFRPMTH